MPGKVLDSSPTASTSNEARLTGRLPRPEGGALDRQLVQPGQRPAQRRRRRRRGGTVGASITISQSDYGIKQLKALMRA